MHPCLLVTRSCSGLRTLVRAAGPGNYSFSLCCFGAFQSCHFVMLLLCCPNRLRRVHASEGCSTDLVFNAPSAPLLRELGHSLEGDEATYMQVAVMVLAQCEMGNLVIRMDDADSVVENNVPSEFEMGNLVIRSVDSGVENNVPSEIDAANVEKNFLSVLNRNVFFNTSLDRQTSFFFSKTSAPDRLASLRDIQGRLIAGLPVPHTMFNAQFRLDDFGTLCLHNRPGQEVQDCYSAFVDGTDQQFQVRAYFLCISSYCHLGRQTLL